MTEKIAVVTGASTAVFALKIRLEDPEKAKKLFEICEGLYSASKR